MSSTEPVVVVATFLPKPADRQQVLRVMDEVIPKVHQEPGCILYAVHEADARLVLVEKWSSAEALAVHGRAEAVTELRNRIEGLLEKPTEVVLLRPHAAGDAERGLV